MLSMFIKLWDVLLYVRYIHHNTGCTTFQTCCEALMLKLKSLVLNSIKIDILCFDLYFVC